MTQTRQWSISPTEAFKRQKQIAEQLSFSPLPSNVNTIAGADCAYLRSQNTVVCSVVLCQWHTLSILEVETVHQPCEFPYVPGLLSFREAPAVIAAVKQLSVLPDILLCDGQGIAHPRKAGLAAHVGILLDIPTVGVAKSRLCGEHREPGRRRRCHTQLRLHGELIGNVVRTRSNVKPLYVSPGHRADIESSRKWTLKTARKFRLPEPLRQAHITVSAKKI